MPESTSAIIKAAYLREMAVKYAWCWVRTPYKWGGDDFSAMDCSGFVVEILQGVGILGLNRDYTANDLMEIFRSNVVAQGYGGCLAFWTDKQGRATHVMLMVDAEHVIGAAGGGSSTTTASDAVRDNAFVKLRPLSYRKTTPVIIDPFIVKGGA